jgi:hypothetical protein
MEVGPSDSSAMQTGSTGLSCTPARARSFMPGLMPGRWPALACPLPRRRMRSTRPYAPYS